MNIGIGVANVGRARRRTGVVGGRRRSRLITVLAGCVVAAAISAPAAQADFGIAALGGSTSIDGEFSRQAGAHPDLTTRIEFPTHEAPYGLEGNVKTVNVALPPGLVGNPTAAVACKYSELTAGGGETAECPVESQVGIAVIGNLNGETTLPLFNVQRLADAPALLAFNYAGSVVPFVVGVRPTDYGVSTHVGPAAESLTFSSIKVTIWGVPADPSHNAQRFFRGVEFETGASTLSAPVPFMTNPTSCPGVPGVTSGEAESWQNPGVFSRATFDGDFDGVPFTTEGCDRLPFEPSMKVSPGTHRAASPTGLAFSLKVPQSNDPYGLATAEVRKVVTTFPKGIAVSPSAVAGLGACSLAEIDIGSNNPPTCPDSSKLGNVTVKSPLLDETLEGQVILARQNENPFHSLFAVYLVVKGPGFYLKLPGELHVDKQSGQLSTVFDDTPQLPFEELALDFRGGPTAPLTTPDVCGTYQTHTEITSWASPTPYVIDAPMVVDEDCTGKGSFRPSLQAGVANPVAGAESPLTLRVRRLDGEQNLSRLEFKLPEGELAKLKGVEVCPENLAPSGACGPKAQVGISTTAIGTGAFPLFVPQPGKAPTALYLAGPYKGAPYSLIAKVPAQSGPFDFGTIVVRTAINLDPVTTQVIAKSDPLPQILEGVPLQYRDVRIEVQKPDFTVNPTSCEQRQVTSTITSVNGAQAHPSVPSKVGDCASLGFGPKLAFKLRGGSNRGDFQALTAVLSAGKHEANIARVAVTLPHSEFLEQSHIGTVCTRVQFVAKNCPDASIYGVARATTPLLDRPLEGPVYLRSSNHSLPDLVAQLNGQFDIELAGRIDSKNGGIRNTFEVVPDAPVSKFTLKMKGGAKSLLVNSRNLCKSVARAEVKMVGQNGKVHNESPVVANSCGKKAKKKAARVKQRRH
jgi:hypothetical protein